MANTNKKRAKSMINVRRATFFGFSDEDNEVYDESKIMELTKRTMSFSDDRNYNSVPNYGDGEETDREYGISGRTVELQIHDLTAEESAFIHGHTVSGKTIRRSQNDSQGLNREVQARRRKTEVCQKCLKRYSAMKTFNLPKSEYMPTKVQEELTA